MNLPDANRGGPHLSWEELSAEGRFALQRKLENLYGRGRVDREVFDSLAVDKQRALLLFADRMGAHGLWPHVRRIDNVYGVGGVGMDFRAWPGLLGALRRHRKFHRFFSARRTIAAAATTSSSHSAARRAGGFRERGRPRAVLHFLYGPGGGDDSPDEPRWNAHFDLDNPFASPRNLWRHVAAEVLRRDVPDWVEIDKALREG